MKNCNKNVFNPKQGGGGGAFGASLAVVFFVLAFNFQHYHQQILWI